MWLTIDWPGVVMKSLRKSLRRHMLSGRLPVRHCRLCLRLLRMCWWLLVLVHRVHQMRWLLG